MDLRVLEYFIAVAEEQNVTRAAEALHISQPTLSRQIMQLEDEFGVELLVRGNKSVSLTAEGKLLKERATELLLLYEKAKFEIQNESNKISGDIYMGVLETHSFHIIAQKIEEFRKKYPDVHFQIVTESSDNITERIEKGLLDMGLVMAPINDERFDKRSISMKSEKWGLIVPTDHPLAIREYVTKEDVIGQALICPKRQLESGKMEKWFPNIKDLDIVATFNLLGNAVTLVREHVGIAVGIEHVAFKCTGLRWIPFQPEIHDQATYLIWKKNHTISKPAGCFLEFLKETL